MTAFKKNREHKLMDELNADMSSSGDVIGLWVRFGKSCTGLDIISECTCDYVHMEIDKLISF